MKYVTVLLTLILSLTGCSTIHFVNGAELDDTVIREEWHHTALNGLIEISPPVNIIYNCDNKQWDTITIERSFLNGLASIPAQYFSVYAPWAVYYECREAID